LLDGTSSVDDAPDNRASRRDSSILQCATKLKQKLTAADRLGWSSIDVRAIPPGVFVHEILFIRMESSAELP